MTLQNVKTALSAPIITAMILPLGAMDRAVAEEATGLSGSEKKELIRQVQSLEAQIQQAEDVQIRESLKSEQQDVLQRLHDDVSDVQTTQATRSDTQQQSTQWRDLFNMYGVNKGCDDANETWHYKVDYDGNINLRVDQWFPSILTSGDSPNCEEHGWETNVYLDIRNVWDGSGCHANLEVPPVDKYPLECATLGGLYIVHVTVDYDGRQTGSWSWFWA